jgi:histone H3
MVSEQTIEAPQTSETKVKIDEKQRKNRRFHPGTVALRQIKKQQSNTDLLLRKAPFQRLVRDIIHDQKQNVRVQKKALVELQRNAESFLISLLQSANECALHANRVTVYPKDMYLATQIRYS